MTKPVSYKRHRFPPEIIAHTVWLYFRFPLSLRLDLGPDITPRAAVGDKDYDAKANRQAARSRGICPAIPYRTTTKDKPNFFTKALYRERARIEQTME